MSTDVAADHVADMNSIRLGDSVVIYIEILLLFQRFTVFSDSSGMLE